MSLAGFTFEKWRERRGDLLRGVAILVFLFSIALALPSLFIPLGLPAEGDAVDYRIPLVQWILRHGKYPNWPWTMIDDYPAFGELLMVPLYALKPALARLVPIGAYVGLGVVSGCLAKKMGAGRTKLGDSALFWLGAAWIVALRPLALQSNLLMVDNLASCFLLFSLNFILEKREKTAGFFAALSMATRYTTWGTAALLPFLLLAVTPRSEQKRKFVVFCCVAALGPAGFMLRNFLLNHGNPFFPIGDALSMRAVGVSAYGRGSNLSSLLLFPYDLLYTNSFVKSIYDYTLGKLFFIQLAAVTLFGGAAFGWFRRMSPIGKVVLAFFFGHLLIWFFSGQQLRFLVPSLVVLNLAMMLALTHRPLVLSVVTLLGVMSVVSIQRDSLAMVFGGRPSIFASAVSEAKDCLTRVNIGDDPIAFVTRDGINGFLDRDFYFVERHPYFVPGSQRQEPEWVYTTRPRDGYMLWPPERPCLQKRKSKA